MAPDFQGGERQQENGGDGVPVEDEDRGARALVEGGLGEDVHAGIDQPDEQHRGVHLAAAHGAVAACLEEMMDGVSASTVNCACPLALLPIPIYTRSLLEFLSFLLFFLFPYRRFRYSRDDFIP